MKRLFWLVICFLMSVVVCGAPTYVTITYKVSSPTGSPPATLYATAQIVYDSSQNPIHTTFPVPASWDATKGEATWNLPVGCYVKFVCQATGLNGIYQIPSSNAYLNDLVPVQPPPEPSWTANLVPYTGATGNVDLGGHKLYADSLMAYNLGIETYGMYQVGSIYNPEEEGFAVTIRSGGSRPYNAITTDGFYARRFVGLSYGSDTKPYIALDDGHKIGENRMFYVNPFVTEGDVFYLTGRNGSFNISKDIALSITKDSVAYEIWSAYNDGRDSGLDADLLDGNHALDFEPALSKGNLSESTSSVLTITGGTNSVIGSGTTIEVKKSSASQDGYLAKEDFATFNSKDGVVGNEVTDTADTTLTRTGAGTAEAPYKLKLNLANANTFTANQTAPYFMQSSQYNPDNPRPLGFPQTNANTLDEEFNGSIIGSWTSYGVGNDATPSLTYYPGYLTFTQFGTKPYYMRQLDTPITGDFYIVLSLGNTHNYAYAGLSISTAEGAKQYNIAVNGATLTATSQLVKGVSTSWGAINTNTPLNIPTQPKYLFIRRRNGKIMMGYSMDMMGVSSCTFHDGTQMVIYATDSSPIAYVGIYQTVYNGLTIWSPNDVGWTTQFNWIRFI